MHKAAGLLMIICTISTLQGVQSHSTKKESAFFFKKFALKSETVVDDLSQYVGVTGTKSGTGDANAVE